jgi:hypothetical protein
MIILYRNVILVYNLFFFHIFDAVRRVNVTFGLKSDCSLCA